MTDKKDDDYAVRIGDDSYEEKSPFVPKSPRSQNTAQPSMLESLSRLDNSPPISIVAYCLSSISMTIVNKYVVSGHSWNLTFFYLAVQVSPRPAVARSYQLPGSD